MTAKEKQLSETLRCPNCDRSHFQETSDNCALGFRCECGLEFNFFPFGRKVQITRDPGPQPVDPLRQLERKLARKERSCPENETIRSGFQAFSNCSRTEPSADVEDKQLTGTTLRKVRDAIFARSARLRSLIARFTMTSKSNPQRTEITEKE